MSDTEVFVVRDQPCTLLKKGEGEGAVVQAPGQTGVIIGEIDCSCYCQVTVAWGDCIHTFDPDEVTIVPKSKMRADLVGRTFDSIDAAKEELGL